MSYIVKWDQRSNCVKYARKMIRTYELSLVDICCAPLVLPHGRFVKKNNMLFRVMIMVTDILSLFFKTLVHSKEK